MHWRRVQGASSRWRKRQPEKLGCRQWRVWPTALWGDWWRLNGGSLFQPFNKSVMAFKKSWSIIIRIWHPMSLCLSQVNHSFQHCITIVFSSLSHPFMSSLRRSISLVCLICLYAVFSLQLFWHCWLGDRKGIRPVKQEAQLMLTNLCDAFGRQSRSPNIVPFHMLGILSYCAIVTVFKTRRFYDIRLQKCRDLEMGSKVTQGHWEWYHSIDGVCFPISVL